MTRFLESVQFNPTQRLSGDPTNRSDDEQWYRLHDHYMESIKSEVPKEYTSSWKKGSKNETFRNDRGYGYNMENLYPKIVGYTNYSTYLNRRLVHDHYVASGGIVNPNQSHQHGQPNWVTGGPQVGSMATSEGAHRQKAEIIQEMGRIAKAPEDIHSFSGMGTFFHDQAEGIKEGDEVHLPAFVSSSVMKQTGVQWAMNVSPKDRSHPAFQTGISTILHFHTPEGHEGSHSAFVGHLSDYKGQEREQLIRAGSNWHVTGVNTLTSKESGFSGHHRFISLYPKMDGVEEKPSLIVPQKPGILTGLFGWGKKSV